MPLSTTPPEPTVRNDQARELRAMIARRTESSTVTPRSARRCRTIVIVGSKGGVGKSVVTLNLATSLAAQLGAGVGLFDASPGTGSLSLLCGQNGYWNLDHVAAGIRTLDEVILSANSNVRILPGADRLSSVAVPTSTWRSLVEFENRHDWLLIDTGSDLDQSTDFAKAADATLIVTTPEPTSVAEAYGAIKRLCTRGVTSVSVLVNQADSEDQGVQIMDRLRHAARAFLTSDIGLAGIVPFDPAVSQSVFRRTPLGIGEATELQQPSARQALEALGRRLTRVVTMDRELTFVESLRNVMNGNSELAQLEGNLSFAGTFSKVGPVGISRRNKVN
ncbi:MAG: P-loop NTPase [Planctomycetota bacterium]